MSAQSTQAAADRLEELRLEFDAQISRDDVYAPDDPPVQVSPEAERLLAEWRLAYCRPHSILTEVYQLDRKLGMGILSYDKEMREGMAMIDPLVFGAERVECQRRIGIYDKLRHELLEHVRAEERNKLVQRLVKGEASMGFGAVA